MNRFLNLYRDAGSIHSRDYNSESRLVSRSITNKSEATSFRPEYADMYQNLAFGSSTGRVSPSTLKTSNKGITFIKKWEAFKKGAYNDSNGFCTIGYGHLIEKKKCKDIKLPEEFKDGISEEKASKLFLKRLPEFENAIHRDIKVPLYQQEFDALISLLYNTGSNFLNVGGANKGTTKIKEHINDKKYHKGAIEMMDVTNGGVAGLIKRRKSEMKLFISGEYNASH